MRAAIAPSSFIHFLHGLLILPLPMITWYLHYILFHIFFYYTLMFFLKNYYKADGNSTKKTTIDWLDNEYTRDWVQKKSSGGSGVTGKWDDGESSSMLQGANGDSRCEDPDPSSSEDESDTYTISERGVWGHTIKLERQQGHRTFDGDSHKVT